MRVLHIITGLEMGGAEAVLYRLLSASSGAIQHEVVSMTGEGVYGPLIRETGIPLHTLGFPRSRVTRNGLQRLWRLIRAAKPDAVQTWMYHANLAGGVAAWFAGVRAICWGIRNSTLDPRQSSRSARLAARLCARLSKRVPAAIVSCSERAAFLHQRLGYDPSKFVIIPNGYDTARFSPQPDEREKFRGALGIAPGTALLGSVARWDPMKDHANLLAALALLARKDHDFQCVLAGAGMDPSNEDLRRLIEQNGLEDKIIPLGPRSDIPGVMNALDLHILSSKYGEAFPNAVCEAMACGTPCVVTDVGDAAAIVGETGWVAPPGDPALLAQRIDQALSEIKPPRGHCIAASCRQRIAGNFGIDRMVKAYESLWLSFLSR